MKKFPVATLLISAATFLYSVYASFVINGSFFSNVSLLQLEAFGGVRLSHLKDLELWRLFVFQLVHVKYLHMIYNVTSILVLGLFVEPYIRFGKFILLWFVSGVVGTLMGGAFIAPPWDLGTGASQAVLGIAGVGVVLAFKRINTSKWLWLALGFSIVPAFALDLIHAGYPKPAHLVSMAIGLVAGYIYLKSAKKI